MKKIIPITLLTLVAVVLGFAIKVTSLRMEAVYRIIPFCTGLFIGTVLFALFNIWMAQEDNVSVFVTRLLSVLLPISVLLAIICAPVNHVEFWEIMGLNGLGALISGGLSFIRIAWKYAIIGPFLRVYLAVLELGILASFVGIPIHYLNTHFPRWITFQI